MAEHETTGEDVREAHLVTGAATTVEAADVVADGLPPDLDEAVGDGSLAAAVTGEPAAAVVQTRSRRRDLMPSWSPKLVVGLVITGLIVLFAIVVPFFTLDPNSTDYDGLLKPGEQGHLLGTSAIGNDIWAQLAHGARGSLLIGVTVGVIALLLSVIFGIFAGYLGGWADETLSLVTNIMLVIPALPLTIVLAAYSSNRSMWLVAGVLGITAWTGSAIVLRTQARSLRMRDYVLAARVAGEKSRRIIAVEILPNLLPLVAAQFLFGVIFAILGEAGLSYLGLGPTDAVTWGTMLYQAQQGSALTLGAWWWFVPPGLLIALLGCGLSLVNFAIDEIINPKLRNVPKATRRVRKAARRHEQHPAAATEEAGA